MKRSRILAIGTLGVVLSVVLTLGGSGYLAWLLMLKSTEQRLETLAELAAYRADETFSQASVALKTLADSDLRPCSDESIEQMQLVALNTLSVKSVGYVEEEVFVCSTLGAVGRRVPQWKEDFRTADGIGVSLNADPGIAAARNMLALQYAAFNLLVDPQALQEASLEPGIRLALGNATGSWMGQARNDKFTRLITRIHTGPHTGLAEGYLYTRVIRGDWHAIVAISRQELLADLWRKELLLLPLGVVLALFCLQDVVRRTRAHLSPLNELRGGVRRSEFRAVYQPIVDLHNGRCVGAEALVRWRVADGRWLTPDAFLPLAEQSGLIEPITDQMIAAICTEMGDYLRADRSRHVSLNLCAADIISGRYLSVLNEALRDSDVEPGQVWLEVTESSLIEMQPAQHNLAISQQRGHRIALDDFGTGYSSLHCLQRLPLDLIKIDKSFVQELNEARTCTVIDHTIAIARQLGLAIVAEGIETEQQQRYLRPRGVDYGQGWLYGKPMPAREFIEFAQHPVLPESVLVQEVPTQAHLGFV
ncbi:MAG: EAL domain-containing protein [Pseudomonas sp.]